MSGGRKGFGEKIHRQFPDTRGIGRHEFMIGDGQGAPTSTVPPLARAMDQIAPSVGR
jgi:hypothetical protein